MVKKPAAAAGQPAAAAAPPAVGDRPRRRRHLQESCRVARAQGLPHATPDMETHPVLYRMDNEHLLQRLWFCDQNTPGKKAKPDGVGGCEIRQGIVAAGGAAPTNPNAMPYLATDTKAPHRTDLEPEDLGKTAYYCQRWVNTTGQPGPWGPITGYPVT